MLHNEVFSHISKSRWGVRHSESPAVNNLLTALTSLCAVLDEWTCGEHVLGRVKEQRRRGRRLMGGHMAAASSSELNVVCSDTPILPPPLLDQGSAPSWAADCLWQPHYFKCRFELNWNEQYHLCRWGPVLKSPAVVQGKTCYLQPSKPPPSPPICFRSPPIPSAAPQGSFPWSSTLDQPAFRYFSRC